MRILVLLLLLATAACQTGSLSSSTSKETSNPAPFSPLNLVALQKDQVVDKFVFGSCAHQKRPQPIWKAILETQPDFYLSLGDTVYASKPEDQPISEAYRLQSAHPDFQEFRKAVPLMGTWDDHDFGQNDGGAFNPLQTEAKRDYLRNMTNDAAEIPENRKGVYHSFLLGKNAQTLQVVLLDTRSYRDELEKNQKPKHDLDIYQSTQDSKKTVLGEEQWLWLEAELKKPAGFRVIASSIQIIPQEHGFEKWQNFPHERDRLLTLLKKLKVKNVILLSGDRHSGEFSQINLPGLGKIWEITASGINRNSTIKGEKNQYRRSEFIVESNFGEISIDWTQKTASLSLKNETGKVLHQESLKF